MHSMLAPTQRSRRPPPSGGFVADTLRDLLARSGVLAHVVVPPEHDAMLSALEVTGRPQPLVDGISRGRVRLVHDLSKSPIPGFDFGLALPEAGITIPFKLKLEPPDDLLPSRCGCSLRARSTCSRSSRSWKGCPAARWPERRRWWTSMAACAFRRSLRSTQTRSGGWSAGHQSRGPHSDRPCLSPGRRRPSQASVHSRYGLDRRDRGAWPAAVGGRVRHFVDRF